ncbi:acyl-protein thioesterase 1 [Arachis duranensis]|uniref:Acyl-protein thioesterase 1 n=1 Tax=Arachis duranensis TaxID=130453 RepID=A0A6P4BZB0_ARADU|nr:acyl-protein thioesterase 1 [Arachis duranensis]
MSYAQHSPPLGSGSKTPSSRRTFEFGKTHVVRPKGKHQATIVWLHGLGDNGLSSSQLLESLRLPNIKWICPTAPIRPVKTLGGFSCTSWFDMREVSSSSSSSENGGNDDWEGLDASASHIANLLSTEPTHVKVGIGGFSMGGAVAAYSATCYAMGSFSNGMPYPLSNLTSVLALSSWLPGGPTCRTLLRNNNNNVNTIHAKSRAASLPIFLAHGIADDVVLYKYGHQSAHSLYSAGFRSITFKSYDGIGHYTIPTEMDDVANWLNSNLGLEG